MIMTRELAPALTDRQILDFCRTGYLMLEGAVPEEINHRAARFCASADPYEPTNILEEAWFVEHVVLNRRAAGAVRALLGRDFHVPIQMTNHRMLAPFPTGGWHIDGNFRHGPELENLLVFYYPQDTPLEMGAMQVLPGSHLVRNQSRSMAHLDGIRGAVSTAAPAGSIFICAYPMWHRRGPATAEGVRNLLRWFCWRTTPPARDWIIEKDFDFATASYGSPIAPLMDFYRSDPKVAEMFLWLCGKHASFKNLGGQSWPMPSRRTDKPYGFPDDLI